jgi:hypothetical protein
MMPHLKNQAKLLRIIENQERDRNRRKMADFLPNSPMLASSLTAYCLRGVYRSAGVRGNLDVTNAVNTRSIETTQQVYSDVQGPDPEGYLLLNVHIDIDYYNFPRIRSSINKSSKQQIISARTASTMHLRGTVNSYYPIPDRKNKHAEPLPCMINIQASIQEVEPRYTLSDHHVWDEMISMDNVWTYRKMKPSLWAVRVHGTVTFAESTHSVYKPPLRDRPFLRRVRRVQVFPTLDALRITPYASTVPTKPI